MRITALVFTSALVASTLAGCGGNGGTTSSGASGSGGGSGSSTSSASTGGSSAGGTGGMGGAPTTSSVSSTSSTSSVSGSTGTGSGTVCGGKLGKPCLPNEYCDFPADKCSLADESGSCTLRPMGCNFNDEPTCACDGMVYGNPCAAAAAGVDINLNGFCMPPTGKFACGAGFCEIGVSYCEIDVSDVGGVPSTHGCKPLPPSCGNPAACSCLASVVCGSMCAPSSDGAGLVVTCPGG